ncbi:MULTISPECIES: hypothetical protein [unclassified Methylophilus]|uniref:hypothetical protein n=1 Tax=unclassified Methylophilus TaxID=2630143 RepID=UPI0006F75C1A|nr:MULTISPECIES: hypothetical protein [unclassified Methylophilus]KQT42497.1 hypothetical protein ASG34_07065 [Methylophilus sp. Leaf416]KQT56680.1 hypothetical protein ASG44_07040 [Methylophilus sp. Leaf459]
MIWKIFKGLINAICLSFATIVLIAAPFSLGIFAFACFLAFLGGALLIDFTKPLSAQNLSPTQRNIAKVAIWGLAIFFVTMFVYSLFNGESHLNGRGFVQLITSLLKAM